MKKIKGVVKDLNDNDVSGLRSVFHRKLRITPKVLQKFVQQTRLTYGAPLRYTVYRVWAVNTKDGSPDPVACHEDGLALGPHYGYPLQFAVWMQIMGSRELGRLYFSMVPMDKEWRIGAWHAQQWTHLGKDPEAWVNEALSDSESKLNVSAYLKLDLAEKLLNGAGYIYPKLKEDVVATKSSYFPNGTWLEAVDKAIDHRRVVYASSIFARDGAGFLVRMLVPRDTKVKSLEKDCMLSAKKLMFLAGSAKTGGVKCSYLMEGESIQKDGYFGSRFISKKIISAGMAQKASTP